MNNLNACKAKACKYALGTALFLGLSVMPFSIAKAAGVSGNSIIQCTSSSLSPDYINSVCLPVQQNADGLLSNQSFSPPQPVVMKDPLDIQKYRQQGVAAIIQYTQGSQKVNSSATNTNSSNSENNTNIWNLQQ